MKRTHLLSIFALVAFFTASCSTLSSDPIRTATSEKPLIGIASLSSASYSKAIRSAGGIPIVLPNADGNPESIATYLDILDGLLMPGGADIPPSEWNEKPHPKTRLLSDDRYRFEKAMISAWIQDTDKPLLGICLGSQWLAVAHGGSLVQDIPSEFGVNHRGTKHKVQLEADSRLRRIVKDSDFVVNSYHHQSVRKPGKGLRVVAKSPDGIIEATETTDPNRFLIGVQWHPEKMMHDDATQARLLRAFVKAAAAARSQRLQTN